MECTWHAQQRQNQQSRINSCRVQTLTNQTNPFFYKLLNNFYQKSGVPVILNTSFNIKGQPIVNDSIDAIKCFKKYNIDVLILENFIIEKWILLI